MTIYSKFRIFSNLFRALFLVIVVVPLPHMVKRIIDDPTSYFNLLIVPCFLVICYFVIGGLMSIKANYNIIIISENRLKVIGLGGFKKYVWGELIDCNEETISGIRIPTYFNFEVFKDKKRILKFDSLTYWNYKKMSEMIQRKMEKVN